MRPQCQWCNRELHGNLDVYREKLTDELGEEKIAELHRQTYQKLYDTDIEAMIPEYEGLLKLVESGKTLFL